MAQSQSPVECYGALIFGVNGQRAHTDEIGHLKSAPQPIEQQAGTDTASPSLGVNRKPREH